MSTYKIAVIGDQDSILGFKTLGVTTFPVTNAHAALAAVSYTHLDVYKRQGFWFVFLIGLISLAFPQFSEIGKWVAIGGAAGLILTQGRKQKGIFKKFFGGLLSLYDVTGYLSDVLSYSRLFAPVSYTHLDVYKRQ